MKKPYLLLSPILIVASLSGCNANATINTYDADSRLVVQSFDEQGSITLPTYRSSKHGDVPYLELKEAFYALGAFGKKKFSVNHNENVYEVKTEDGSKTLLTVDPSKDVFTVSNYQLWSNLTATNNDIGPDLASPSDEEIAAVHTSEKTKIIGDVKDEVYDLSKYGFDFIEQDGKCYGPALFISSMYLRNLGIDLTYNGFDYYFSMGLNGALPAVTRSYYSGNKRFAVQENNDATSYAPVGEEAYRFVYETEIDKQKVYRIMSLTKDQKGQLLEAASPTEVGKQAVINDATYAYQWEKKGDFLFVTTIASGKSIETGEQETVNQGTQKIPLKDGGFYGTKKRSKETRDFTYSMLQFQFENYYGLRKEAETIPFDTFVSNKGLKEGLKSLDADTYDVSLIKLLMTHIDDAHTLYNLPSIYSGKFAPDVKPAIQENLGPRYKGLLQKHASYVDTRSKALGLTEKDNPVQALGLFTENQTAVIRFDEFPSVGSFVSNIQSYKDEEKETTPLEALKNGDFVTFIDSSFYRISSDKNIKNVVIDLTCNGGGVMSTLPYILAHFTDDPYIRLEDTIQNVMKEFHYKVDLNHDKVWGGPEDTYKGKYNFYILTSDYSFSCAHFLPSFAKELGVKTVGMQTGGGACTVGGYTDGSGSLYNLSSPSVLAAKSGDGYSNYDKGLPVDYTLDSSSWYDLKKLDSFLSTIK